ncbi:hypothetical protein [Amycolatopsis nalaikhensis]|uniref:Uncharacterized protein n=2 Tax=Amycolatopsis TaxID=1813 RepID=A0ABY8XIV9_9PSEU|nr:hypothetical protein [Amycolatopsis sp. 2-2]WIV55526.1 hypothetical protein QP939_43035 [Amycolatopsis sp. 2-2]
MAEFRGLGFDPVLGRPVAVTEAARRCTEAAARLGDSPVPGEIPEWAGPSARALTDRAEQAAAGLADLPDALRSAAAVLDTWAETLAAHLRHAEELDLRATAARRALLDAEDEVERAETEAQFSPSTAEVATARARLAERRTALDRILTEARELERAHTAEATRVADRLRALGDGVPLPEAPDFPTLATQLETFSAAGRELGVTVARTPVTPVTPPPGAVSAFANALGGR